MENVQPPPRRETSASQRRAACWLGLLILCGLILRIWYASANPHSGRFWDERYSFDNVRAILATGTLDPASSYYPYPLFTLPATGLVAASDLLYRWTRIERFLAISDDGFRSASYLLCRLNQVAYGASALALLFLVGRRIFSTRVGLLAALGLAFTPWHIHASGYFKPDALLVLTTLLAFYLSLRAISEPKLASYLLAGVGIALALSSKMTGGLIAIPLAAASLVEARRQPRQLALLLAAAATSMGFFMLLNPYWRSYPAWLAGLQRDYAMRAGWYEMTRVQIPGRVLDLVTGSYGLGVVVGSLSLVGYLVLSIGLLRRSLSRADRIRRFMLLIFPLVYILAYALQTPYFKGNNFLPILPFVWLVGAWALHRIWRLAAAWAPPASRRYVSWAAIVLLVALLAPSGVLYVYRSLTPTTLDQALAFLETRFRPPSGRLVYVEAGSPRDPPWEEMQSFARGLSRVELADRLDHLDAAQLSRADGEAFLRRNLESGNAAFYRRRIERAHPQRVRYFEPQLFSIRGPALVAIDHRHQLREPAIPLKPRRCRGVPGCYSILLPSGLESGEWVSLVVWIRMRLIGWTGAPPQLRLAGRSFPLLETSRKSKSALFVTERFAILDPQATLRIVLDQPRRSRHLIAATLCRWAGLKKETGAS